MATHRKGFRCAGRQQMMAASGSEIKESAGLRQRAMSLPPKPVYRWMLRLRLILDFQVLGFQVLQQQVAEQGKERRTIGQFLWSQ